MEKILITGTGRCGTTFLIKLFSFLGFDTGYNRNNYKLDIYKNCNSGMEKNYNCKHYIVKSPYFIDNIENIIKDKSVKIKYVIIPIRDLIIAAQSRLNHKNQIAGLWNATNLNTQVDFYKHILVKYLCISTKYDINTIYLDFKNMVNDKEYLFTKLKNILDEKNIDFETFSNVYDEVTLTCKV